MHVLSAPPAFVLSQDQTLNLSPFQNAQSASERRSGHHARETSRPTHKTNTSLQEHARLAKQTANPTKRSQTSTTKTTMPHGIHSSHGQCSKARQRSVPAQPTGQTKTIPAYQCPDNPPPPEHPFLQLTLSKNMSQDQLAQRPPVRCLLIATMDRQDKLFYG